MGRSAESTRPKLNDPKKKALWNTKPTVNGRVFKNEWLADTGSVTKERIQPTQRRSGTQDGKPDGSVTNVPAQAREHKTASGSVTNGPAEREHKTDGETAE